MIGVTGNIKIAHLYSINSKEQRIHFFMPTTDSIEHGCTGIFANYLVVTIRIGSGISDSSLEPQAFAK